MKKQPKMAKIANFVFFCYCCRQSATRSGSASRGAFFPYAPTPFAHTQATWVKNIVRPWSRIRKDNLYLKKLQLLNFCENYY
jgi:hypothetical protein